MTSFAQTYRGESLKLNRWNWMDLGSGNWNLMDSLSPLGSWFASDPGDEKSLFYNDWLVAFCVMSCWLQSIPQWTGVCSHSQITIPLVSQIWGQGLNRNWGQNTFSLWWLQAFLCWLRKTKTAIATVHALPIFYVRRFYYLGLLSLWKIIRSSNVHAFNVTYHEKRCWIRSQTQGH